MKNRLPSWLRAVLYPPVPLMIILVILSTAVLSLSLSYLEATNALAILCYMIAFYTLSVVGMRVPKFIAWIRRVKNDNRFLHAYFTSPRTRVKISLYFSLVLNGAYTLFQFFLGLRHSSVWYYSLAAYYLILTVTRFLLLGYTRAYAPGERMMAELRKYRATGILLIILNIALTGVVTLTVLSYKVTHHHEITVIAMAAYTFTALTLAIVSTVKFRRYGSPVFMAVKSIALITATVSMLSLESSMLTTFGGEDPTFNRIMLAATGAAVMLSAISVSVYMTVTANKRIRDIKNGEDNVANNQTEE